MVVVGFVIDYQYDCNKVNQEQFGLCMMAKPNIILGIDFIVGLLGTPLIVQGYRNWKSDLKPKYNKIGLIDGVEGE